MIELRLLGEVDLRRDGTVVGSVLAQPKRFALLAWLAASHPPAYQSRDRALALFWPEQDSAHARAALSRALHYLRSSLGRDVLVSRGNDEIGVCEEGLSCDLRAFGAAVADCRHRDAVGLYRGDLLDGFFIAGSPGFEQWLESERERIRTMACLAGRAVAESEQAAGNPALASHWAHWVVAQSPFDQAGVQWLMRLLDSAGDRAGAVHAHERFAHRLQHELELTPSPATQSLLATIRLRERMREQSATGGGTTRDTVYRLVTNEPSGLDRTGTRFESVESVESVESAKSVESVALDDLPPSITTVSPIDRLRQAVRTRARLPWTAAGLTLTLAASAGLALAVSRVFELDPNRVVVVPFQNHTGDPSLDALAALATRVVAENLAGVAQGIETATPSTRRGGAITGRSEVRRIANEFHAGIVITGRIESEGDEIHFRAELHSLHNGDRRTASLTRSGAGHSVWPIGPVAARTDSPARALHEVRERVNGGVAAWMDPAFSPWLGLALATPRSTFWTGRSVPMVRTPPIAPSNEPPNCRPLSCPLLHSVHTSRTGRTRPGPH